MKKQLSTLQQLIGVMDPELFRHLEKVDGLNLFFCFRYVYSTTALFLSAEFFQLGPDLVQAGVPIR